MKFRIWIPVMAVCWFWGMGVLLPAGPARAAQGAFLGDKHKSRGIACSACHKETPPKQNVPMAVCVGCHGDYRELAAKTEKIDPNPHDSHLGETECGKCHHSHKASENACAACHPMDMKVP